LRLVSPVQYMRRTAMEDTELNGQKIAKDEKVVMWYGAANRDPSIFPDPDRFNMMRPNVDKHLAFGQPNILVHAISSLSVNLYGPDGKRPTQIQGKSFT